MTQGKKFSEMLANVINRYHNNQIDTAQVIHRIVEIIRKNATVDWKKRADVKAKLRLLVKKVLMRYGYPPDLVKMEVEIGNMGNSFVHGMSIISYLRKC